MIFTYSISSLANRCCRSQHQRSFSYRQPKPPTPPQPCEPLGNDDSLTTKNTKL